LNLSNYQFCEEKDGKYESKFLQLQFSIT